MNYGKFEKETIEPRIFLLKAFIPGLPLNGILEVEQSITPFQWA
jgi:hypothetical protein